MAGIKRAVKKVTTRAKKVVEKKDTFEAFKADILKVCEKHGRWITPEYDWYAGYCLKSNRFDQFYLRDMKQRMDGEAFHPEPLRR